MRRFTVTALLFASLGLISCEESELEEKPSVDAGTADISGKVINASTGQPVNGATVSITDLSGVSTTTNGAGEYSFEDVAAGSHTVKAEKSGFNSDQTTFALSGGQDVIDKNLTVLPISFAAGKYSIVLTWGEEPLDLDSHLFVPTGTSGYEINYMDTGDSDGTLDAAPFAALDVDQQYSFGPETVTIAKTGPNPHYGGKYRYYVHNYSETPGFNVSHATVKVYDNGTLVKTYSAPTTGSGHFWHVFDIEGATITDVNVVQAAQVAAP